MTESQTNKRVVIENVTPSLEGGTMAVKRVTGEKVTVRADIFADGHDLIIAELLHKKKGADGWDITAMRHIGNDKWTAAFPVEQTGTYFYTVRAWVDHFRTWQADLKKKYAAAQDLKVDLEIGAQLLEDAADRAGLQDAEDLRERAEQLKRTRNVGRAVELALDDELSTLAGKYPDGKLISQYALQLPVAVSRRKALFSAWYEMFPRSCGRGKNHGTFADCERLLPEIAKMGFDVLYLPPVHPIGETNRKGKNNSPMCGADDPGSCWAIGNTEGGHTAVHRQLGTLDDFRRLVAEAEKHGLEVAMDLAFQCSPDHPYVKEHPQWFRWRPDGTVQFAENPPKKYEDIIPLNFETQNPQQLWHELKSVLDFWIEQGVRIFRVDNPHTKPFAFWQWLIGETKRRYEDVIFLSEAFTRPKVMKRLAKVGFDQSYTYFTWRNTKYELQEYLTELTASEAAEYFRPNFWPNTPDILPQYLQFGGRSAFIIRLVLAATLSSSYGIYGPAFELCVTEGLEGREEYADSEKYEIKDWDRNRGGNIKAVIERVNKIRRENPALQQSRNLSFFETDNEMIICYGKTDCEGQNLIITVVNLDPHFKQSCWVTLPLETLDINPHQPYMMHDLLSGDRYIWQGHRNYLELDPAVMPAHILRVHRRLRRETDFDYFM